MDEMEPQQIVEMLRDCGYELTVGHDEIIVTPPGCPEGFLEVVRTQKQSIIEYIYVNRVFSACNRYLSLLGTDLEKEKDQAGRAWREIAKIGPEEKEPLEIPSDIK